MEIRKKLPNRKFVAAYLALAMPLILQSILMASVKLIDSLMVGGLDVEGSPLTAVGSTGKIIFFVELLIWGPLGAVGIYTSQYFGSGNNERLKQTFRFKLIFVTIVAICGFLAFFFFTNTLTSIFLDSDESAATINLARSYMKVMSFYFFGSALSCAFGFTYRELGMTKIVIISAISAVLINTFLNYCLIGGNFGAPALGVKGAAIATVIAKFTEFGILFVYTLYKKPIFHTKIKDIFKIDSELLVMMRGKLAFFTLNELTYGIMSLLHYKAYSTRGELVLESMVLSDTLAQFMYATFQGVSVVIAIYVGKQLGANELKKAEDNASKTIITSLAIALIASVCVIVLSPFVIGLDFFAVDDATRSLAQKFIILECIMFPLSMLGYNMFFIFRNGGDTKSVGFLDMYYILFVSIPLALVLAYLTDFTAIQIRSTIILFECFKISFAIYRYKKKIWLRKLV